MRRRGERAGIEWGSVGMGIILVRSVGVKGVHVGGMSMNVEVKGVSSVGATGAGGLGEMKRKLPRM